MRSRCGRPSDEQARDPVVRSRIWRGPAALERPGIPLRPLGVGVHRRAVRLGDMSRDTVSIARLRSPAEQQRHAHVRLSPCSQAACMSAHRTGASRSSATVPHTSMQPCCLPSRLGPYAAIQRSSRAGPGALPIASDGRAGRQRHARHVRSLHAGLWRLEQLESPADGGRRAVMARAACGPARLAQS